MKLGVNVDHVATLRQARGTEYPDPVTAAMICEYAGCSSIVAHLREDRRHIGERDIVLIQENINIPFNLEMSINKSIVDFALKVSPQQATIVPERRRELTTEAGLNVVRDYSRIYRAVKRLQDKGIIVSLFINPDKHSIEASKKMGVDLIEINTGKFSETNDKEGIAGELKKIREGAVFAKDLGFPVAAGHGIDYRNVKGITKIKEIEELNIGHSIISRSVYIGLTAAVEEMIELMDNTDKLKIKNEK